MTRLKSLVLSSLLTPRTPNDLAVYLLMSTTILPGTLPERSWSRTALISENPRTSTLHLTLPPAAHSSDSCSEREKSDKFHPFDKINIIMQWLEFIKISKYRNCKGRPFESSYKAEAQPPFAREAVEVVPPPRMRNQKATLYYYRFN